MIYRIYFANQLRCLRNDRNLTQQQLADALNWHQTTINHYEVGNRFPVIDNLVILADFFDCSIDSLIGRG